MTENRNQQVYGLIKQIPEGKVVTYRQIANHLGFSNARLIGQILHLNPDPLLYPCHRVVHKDGALATGYKFGGIQAQKKKLQNEGVLFVKEKVDLKRSLYNFVGGHSNLMDLY